MTRMPSLSKDRAGLVLVGVAAGRSAMGLGLLALAKPMLKLVQGGEPDGFAVLGLRIVGVRDLLIGLGTLEAARSDPAALARWTTVGMANDIADSVLGAASAPSLGKLKAALIASGSVPFVAAEVWGLRELKRS